MLFFFFQAEDGIRDLTVTGVQTCALPIFAAQYGHTFEFHAADVGGAAIDKTGRPLPEETFKLAQASDAILLGAVGGPKWDGLAYEVRPERALLGLRERVGLDANLRPAKLYSMLADAST